MLVLTRKDGERIIMRLPDGSKIVLSFQVPRRENKVRVGIDAGREIEIYREEIWDRMEREGKAG